MGYIHFSKDESGIFGLNFGRGTIANHNWTVRELQNEIISNRYDMVRVKIKSDDSAVFEKINQLGFPYFVYSIILRNQIEITGAEYFDEAEIGFELFDGLKHENLQLLVR
ncbi:MAG: hypothetical protein JWO06_708, partial [Bacteroidota bacterium]|nr:hypothetical protein [Bacteroidota bacterium]